MLTISISYERHYTVRTTTEGLYIIHIYVLHNKNWPGKHLLLKYHRNKFIDSSEGFDFKLVDNFMSAINSYVHVYAP